MKRTYVYDEKLGRVIEVTRRGSKEAGIRVMPDMPDFVSPIDGKVYRGRKGFREHCKIHDVTHVNDYKNFWKQKEQERREEPKRARQERLGDIAQAWNQWSDRQ